MLLLLTLLLTLCTAASAATTSNQSTNYTKDKIAAGSTSTTTTVSFYQLNKAAASIKNFIDNNKRLPAYVTISNQQLTMPQYLRLLSYGVVNLNKGSTTPITIKTVKTSTNPSQTVKSGSLTKTSYVKVAGNLKTFITTYGRLPNYTTTALGNMRYESLIYTYCKIVTFYGTNKRLPYTVSVASWKYTTNTTTNTTYPTDLTKYLQPTANCQSTDPTITSLAASITSGLTSNYAKANAIFNWVRDHLTYSYYYNTKKGALGALSSRSANCVDTSHLVIALARAANLPARYQHGTCKFSDGWFGHVWAQIYVDGSWYYADAISDRNTFGSIYNWDLSTVTIHGTYAELPF